MQTTFETVFLPRYESLKLNHDTNYLTRSEDPLVSVQFYIKGKSFSFRVTVHVLFSFLLKKTLRSVFLPPYESLKQNHVTNYLIESEDTVEDSLKCVQFYIKSKSFFISCYSPSTVFILFQKTLKSVFLQRYKPLKLNHVTNYLMTSVDIVEDPLMSVQF